MSTMCMCTFLCHVLCNVPLFAGRHWSSFSLLQRWVRVSSPKGALAPCHYLPPATPTEGQY